MGKGEIARYEQFLLFPQCFQKACFPGMSKGVVVWEWVNNPFQNTFGKEENVCTCFSLTMQLTLPQTSPCFNMSGVQVFENTSGKGEIACQEQFLLFSQCFLPFWITFCQFHKIQNCRLQTLSVWKSLKFFIWDRVKEKFSCFRHIVFVICKCLMRNCSLSNKESVKPSKFKAFIDNK